MAAVNLAGVWSNTPIRGKFHSSLDCWYDRSGNLTADKLGLVVKDGITTFASTSKTEVEIWLSGLHTAFSMLKRYTR